MICPNCSHEIPDGLLMCEKCGAEITIVPEFEIDVENSINETLSSIVDELNPDEKEKNTIVQPRNKTQEEKIEEDFFKERESLLTKKPKKSVLSYILLSVVVVIAAAVLSVLFAYKNFSVNYQIREADAALKETDYETALSYINRAMELKGNDSELILKKTNILLTMGYEEDAIELLNSTIDNVNLLSDDLLSVYGALIAIYAGNEDYQTIADLLKGCTDEAVLSEYSEYTANAPTFSEPTGNYDSEVILSILADESGQIVYTMNGFDPTASKGSHYNRPLILRSGEYDVRAIYINSFGISSEVATSYYLIDSEIPPAPTIEPESGEYDKPFVLSVEVPEGCKVYYTMDGRDPSVEDNATFEYSKPINIDFGSYNCSFMTVSDDGICSEVVKRSYTVTLNTKVTVKMAEYQLIDTLSNLGYEGVANGTYSYKYDSIIDISGLGYYYKLDEYLKNESGIEEPTGNLYAVDVYDNSVYILTVDESGNWGIIPLG